MEIKHLIEDIYKTVKRKDGWFTEELAKSFSTNLGQQISTSMSAPRPKPTLRLSQMGPRCPRALWYSIHHPELAQPNEPWVEIKFAYGHMVEALTLSLIKASGHEVTGEQDALVAAGITGHRDCVIDGCIVDIKSSSSRGMDKFKSKSFVEDDLFGYLDQLDGYLLGSAEDPLVRVKDKAYLLTVDKTLGHMALYEHTFREQRIQGLISNAKRIVGLDAPPNCTCGTKSIGSSGNIGLDVAASYSPFKYICFPHLRTFLYASGPVYLTKVIRKPDVVEIDKYGKLIYNS